MLNFCLKKQDEDTNGCQEECPNCGDIEILMARNTNDNRTCSNTHHEKRNKTEVNALFAHIECPPKSISGSSTITKENVPSGM